MKVIIEPKTTMYDIVRSFLICTKKLDKIDEYVIISEYDRGYNIFELTDKGKDLVYKNLVNTNNPHMQIMNKIHFKILIFDVSRAVLQEWSRHRIGNDFTAQSTRYCIGQIKDDEDIVQLYIKDPILKMENIIKKYYYIPYNDFINVDEFEQWVYDRYKELCLIKYYKSLGMKNDQLKKYINEYMLASIDSDMSATALLNMFNKRLGKKVFYQYRELMEEIKNKLPEEFNFIKDMIKIL